LEQRHQILPSDDKYERADRGYLYGTKTLTSVNQVDESPLDQNIEDFSTLR